MGITRRQRRGQSGQILVVFAISATAMLAVVGMLYSFGLILAQRRALQTAADAASLAGTWQLVAELASDNRSDAKVRSSVMQFASSNGVNTADVAAVYVDATGAQVGTVGGSDPFPPQARGVRVALDSQVPTILPGFVRVGGVPLHDSAAALASATAPPGAASLVIPIAISQASYASHAMYDLFGRPPPGAAWSTLDFASGGLGAPTFGPPSTNEQYWSDGQHSDAWQLSQPATVNLAGAAYYDSVAAGLRDNVRRQGLVDSAGHAYALVRAPVYDTSTSSSVHVIGFVELKIVGANISAMSAPGLFVPYVAMAYGAPSVPSVDVGAIVVGISA